MSDDRLSVWILGDQLLAQHPALIEARQTGPRERVRVVLVESKSRTRCLPYQRKKMVLLFSAMRHYAAGLREQGYTVDYLQASSFLEGLREHVAAWQPGRLLTMAASEYQTRLFQKTRLAGSLGITVTVLPNTQFLVGQFDPYPDAEAKQRVVMEYFYRRMRRHFDLLMASECIALPGSVNQPPAISRCRHRGRRCSEFPANHSCASTNSSRSLGRPLDRPRPDS